MVPLLDFSGIAGHTFKFEGVPKPMSQGRELSGLGVLSHFYTMPYGRAMSESFKMGFCRYLLCDQKT